VPTTRDIGRRAEELAAELLMAKGFLILEKNFRAKVGEIDLVAKDKDEVVFVEVRSRAGSAHGAPEETVDRRKALRVVAAATDWARRHGALEDDIRFDVLAVTGSGDSPEFALFEGAFDASGGPTG